MSSENRRQRIERKKNLCGETSWIRAVKITHVELTYESTSLLDVVHPATRYKTRSFGDKAVDVALTSLPMVDRHVANIANVTESRERRMKKQREQRTMMVEIWGREFHGQLSSWTRWTIFDTHLYPESLTVHLVAT
jgi:hypothetical protein